MKLTQQQIDVNRMITHRMFPCLLLLAIGTIVFGFGDAQKPRRAWWGFETWICPNENCRYENYTAIEYCGLCGTKRSMKGRRSDVGAQYVNEMPADDYVENFEIVYFDGHIWTPIKLEHHELCPCHADKK
jgi:hypothetical protein